MASKRKAKVKAKSHPSRKEQTDFNPPMRNPSPSASGDDANAGLEARPGKSKIGGIPEGRPDKPVHDPQTEHVRQTKGEKEKPTKYLVGAVGDKGHDFGGKKHLREGEEVTMLPSEAQAHREAGVPLHDPS